MHIRGQLDGHEPWRVHGERVEMGNPRADDQRRAARVPSASDFPLAGNGADGRLASGKHFPLRRPHDLGGECLMRGHHGTASGGQRKHDHRRAAQHRRPFSPRREGRGSEHQQHAAEPGQRRRAGGVEINARAQNQRDHVMEDVVGAPSGGCSPRVVEQQADRQRRRHDQLEGEVDHTRADARDPPEQNVVGKPRLRIGEDHPDAPKRIADVDNGKAKQHRDSGCADNHRRHHAGSARGVHRDPSRGQNAASHCDLSDERHGEGVRDDRHAARPDQHRRDHGEQSPNRARQDEASARPCRNEHMQPGQEDQHGARHDVGSAERQRGGRKPKAGQDREQQRSVRPRGQTRQCGGVRNPGDWRHRSRRLRVCAAKSTSRPRW